MSEMDLEENYEEDQENQIQQVYLPHIQTLELPQINSKTHEKDSKNTSESCSENDLMTPILSERTTQNQKQAKLLWKEIKTKNCIDYNSSNKFENLQEIKPIIGQVSFKSFLQENEDEDRKTFINNSKLIRNTPKNRTTSEVLYGFGNYSKSIIQEEDSDYSESRGESKFIEKKLSQS